MHGSTPQPVSAVPRSFPARTAMLAAMLCLSGALTSCETVPDQIYHPVTSAETFVEPITMSMHVHGWGVDNPRLDPPNLKFRPVVFHKAYLEFQENGDMFSDAQKQAILNKIDTLKDPRRPVFLVTYAHGWHHNAFFPKDLNDAKSLNLNAVKFDYFVARFAEHVRRQFEHSGDSNVPVVIGVYIGWRGERLKGDIASLPTLDDRAHAADIVASNSGAKGLKQALREFSQRIEGTHPESRTLVTGHSLGGRMMSRMFLKDIADGTAYPLGKSALIVALEPAIGAECFDAVFTGGVKGEPGGFPSFIAMTSENDTAITKTYALATHIGIVAPPVCSTSSLARGQAIGNYPPYITHDLRFFHVADGSPGKLTIDGDHTVLKPDGSLLYHLVGSDRSSWWLFRHGRTFWKYPYFDQASQDYNFNDYTLYMLELTHGRDFPFPQAGAVWNVRIDKNLIDVGPSAVHLKPGSIGAHHNGIASTGLADILGRIVFAEKNNTTMRNASH